MLTLARLGKVDGCFECGLFLVRCAFSVHYSQPQMPRPATFKRFVYIIENIKKKFLREPKSR